MIREHLTEYAGLPVVEFLDQGAEEQILRRAVQKARRAEKEPPASTPHRDRMEEAKKNPGAVAWRLRISSYTEEFLPYLARFVEEVDTSQVTALVIGDWGLEDDSETSSREVRDALIGRVAAFPALRALFLGDITFEENEISWIHHCDLAPLLAAYPGLEELTVRGVGDTYGDTDTLSLNTSEHRSLRSLTLQSGGLPGRVVREVLSSGLPALERLELWLGVDDYGGDADTEDMAPLLSGLVFPNLSSLGLRNSDDADTWTRVLADAPVTSALETLDLSLGVLTDVGAQTLLDAPVFHGLRRLDLHHHFLSEDMELRLGAALTASGVEHDLSDRQKPEVDDDETYYYTAVSE